MKWLKLAAVVAGSGLLAACQTAHTDPVADAPAQTEATPTLDQRLAALEEQVAEARSQAEQAEARATRAEQAAGAARRAQRAPREQPRAEPAPVRVASTDPVRALPEPRPAATPRPTPVPRIEVPRGTRLELALETPLSSRNSRVGDPVVARVSSATAPGGEVALPGGAWLEGRVSEVAASGRVSGRARLAVRFDKLVVRGERLDVDTSDLSIEADKGTKRDAAVVGGSAAAGAVIGGIAGGKRGLGKGILIGGAAGTAAVLATRGEEVELPAGARINVELLEALRF